VATTETTSPLRWPVAPMKAVSGPLPHGPQWRYEPKWDGHRALVRAGDGTFVAVSSSGRSRTAAWSWMEDALHVRRPGVVVLDGEVIAVGPDGSHAFQWVGRPDVTHAVVLFDLLAVGATDLTGAPWDERRALLVDLVEPSDRVVVTPTTTDGDALYEITRQHALEGVVAKRVDSPYLPGRRSPQWIKSKHRTEQEFVIGGYLTGTGSRVGLGSLLLGVYEPDATLRFVGAAGSGLTESSLASIGPALTARATETCPFDPAPDVAARRARWVRPELVAQIRFGGWTERGRLRHPVVLGLRDDVDPAAVVREP
jgi:bifunctional non-homologous end joining protein LigD